MKKALFCMMLIAASLISGWCLADIFYYCETEGIGLICKGTVPGQEPLGGGVTVDCVLSGGTLYACIDTSYFWYSCEKSPCKGSSSNSTASPCFQIDGWKGCSN